jgi:hypothetical protein
MLLNNRTDEDNPSPNSTLIFQIQIKLTKLQCLSFYPW